MAIRENKLTALFYKLSHYADTIGEDKLCTEIDSLCIRYKNQTLNKEDKKIISIILLIKKWL